MDGSGVRVDALLCDSAQVVDGKLYLLGGGWSATLAVPHSSAIALVVSLPASSDGKHRVDLALVDDAGAPLMFPTSDGEVPLRISAEFETAPIPGAATVTVPLAIGLGPLPCAPDRGYEWRISVDGQSNPEWKVAFHVVAPPPA
jgi:hypothetical protein